MHVRDFMSQARAGLRGTTSIIGKYVAVVRNRHLDFNQRGKVSRLPMAHIVKPKHVQPGPSRPVVRDPGYVRALARVRPMLAQPMQRRKDPIISEFIMIPG